MNIQQGIEIAKSAKEAGYVIAVKNGKVQFQTVVFRKDGTSNITPHTDWVDYDEAVDKLTAILGVQPTTKYHD